MRRQAPRPWLLLLAPLVGCSKGSASSAPAPVPDPFASIAPAPSPSLPPAPPSAPASTTPAVASAPAPKSTVNLLDPGREPRRALRYAWHPEQKEQMAIELSTTVSTEAGGMRSDTAFAPLEITVAIEPRGVSPAGDLAFAWHVASANVGSLDASTPPEIAQGWAAQLGPLQHLSGTGSVSSRGLSRGVSLDAGSAGDAGPDAEMVVQVMQMLRDAAAPLPEEPVGTGARWQKVSTLDARTGHAIQTDTFTLAHLQGDQGVLDDVLAQTASPQAAPAPEGMPGAPPAHMDQLLTSGTEKLHFDLARLVSQITIDGTTSMALSAPSNRMNMVMHLGVTVRGTSP